MKNYFISVILRERLPINRQNTRPFYPIIQSAANIDCEMCSKYARRVPFNCDLVRTSSLAQGRGAFRGISGGVTMLMCRLLVILNK
ncbi:MAG: hypothetical protein MI864_08790 [Pseudomonadales bacterium]|nr:hypothetical protein [Pseudomonadales bacterium]